jgi:hypothetical protein
VQRRQRPGHALDCHPLTEQEHFALEHPAHVRPARAQHPVPVRGERVHVAGHRRGRVRRERREVRRHCSVGPRGDRELVAQHVERGGAQRRELVLEAARGRARQRQQVVGQQIRGVGEHRQRRGVEAACPVAQRSSPRRRRAPGERIHERHRQREQRADHDPRPEDARIRDLDLRVELGDAHRRILARRGTERQAFRFSRMAWLARSGAPTVARSCIRRRESAPCAGHLVASPSAARCSPSSCPSPPPRRRSRTASRTPPPGYVWGGASVSNTATWGSRGYRQGYAWSVGVGSEAQVCVQGWGFDSAHPHGGWFGLGCGSDGGGTVPWGNVLAMPKLRAKSYSFLGTAVPWRD